MEDEEDKKYIEQVFYGILRNATLLHNNKSEHIPHTCILWRDLRTLLGYILPSGEPESIGLLYRLNLVNSPKTVEECDRIEGLYDLYDMIVPCVPNVTLHGIEMFTVGSIRYGHNDLLGIVKCVNACIVRDYMLREGISKLKYEDYNRVIFILGGLRGRKALSCMLSVLERDLSEPNHNHFTDVLRRVVDSIKSYLRNDQPLGTFDEYMNNPKKRYNRQARHIY